MFLLIKYELITRIPNNPAGKPATEQERCVSDFWPAGSALCSLLRFRQK